MTRSSILALASLDPLRRVLSSVVAREQVPVQVVSATTSAPCALHAVHSPHPYGGVELHHVIPQAWQRFVPVPQRLPDGAVRGHGELGVLWDARTTPCCPTGHRSVHHWIVGMLRALAAGAPDLDHAQRIATVGTRPPREEVRVARLALERWAEAGADWHMLAAAQLWGNA